MGEAKVKETVTAEIMVDGRSCEVEFGVEPGSTVDMTDDDGDVAAFTRAEVRAMLPLLRRFAETGGLDARSQILALAELRDGWFDGGGAAYDPAALGRVAAIVGRVASIASARVYPSPAGRIRVEWGDAPRADSLEVDPRTLGMRMHLHDLDSGETFVGEIAPEAPTAGDADEPAATGWIRTAERLPANDQPVIFGYANRVQPGYFYYSNSADREAAGHWVDVGCVSRDAPPFWKPRPPVEDAL